MPATQLPLSCLTWKRLGDTLVNPLPVQVFFVVHRTLARFYPSFHWDATHVMASQTIQYKLSKFSFWTDFGFIPTLYSSLSVKWRGECWNAVCDKTSFFLSWQSSVAVWGQILTTNDFVATKLYTKFVQWYQHTFAIHYFSTVENQDVNKIVVLVLCWWTWNIQPLNLD